MTRPIYDARITLGNIITVVSMLAAVAVAYADFRSERALLAQRMAAIEKRMDNRDSDHDRIVSMEADIKIIRSLLEKRQ
jgi:hypothetical protein